MTDKLATSAGGGDALSEKLWDLSTSIIALAKDAESKGQIERVKVAYFKRKFTDFEYKDGQIGRQGWTYDYFEKTEWHVDHLLKFYDSLKKLAEYDTIASQISKTYATTVPQAGFWLSRFAQTLTRKALDGIEQKELVGLISRFSADLEGAPQRWHVKVWLNGAYSSTSPLVLSESAQIRNPEPSDFGMERRLEDAVQENFGSPLPGQLHPSAILEITRRAKNQAEIQFEVETLLTALRLFRVGALTSLRTEWSSDSVIGFHHFSTGSVQQTIPQDRFKIGPEDLENLKGFLQAIQTRIPVEAIRGGEKNDYLITALQRFNDSTLKSELPESRLTFGMMALEALYLKHGERAELEHRLGQRASRVLGVIGQNSLEVYNLLKRCYDVRSKYVHGEALETTDRQFAAENIPRIQEVVRASLVLALQLKEGATKEQFLNLVDNSLLSADAEAKLRSQLEKACHFH